MADQIELCRYHYDPLDRLASRTPLARVVARQFYDGTQLATELQGSEQRSFFRAGGQLLAQQSQTGDELSNALIATDQQGSVLNAVTPATQNPIAYSAYGHRPVASASPGLPGFNGEQPDPLTGNYLLGNGYRAFNPVLMRFNSPDSLSPFGGGGVNPYTYCLGDPINRTDPSGHMSWQAGLGLGLSVLGIGLSIVSFGAATPLAIAGLATGLVSSAAGVAQAVTEESAPEASSILGWVSLGLGVASAGFGVAAGFRKVGDKINRAFVPGLSGRSAGGRGIGTLGPKGLPPPAPTLEGMPLEILDRITRKLRGKSMAALSQVSPQMNSVVNGLSASRFAKIMETAGDYGAVIIRADEIGMGGIRGIAPSAAKRAGFTLQIAMEDYPFPWVRIAPNGRFLSYGRSLVG